jgi:hypothetical protein
MPLRRGNTILRRGNTILRRGNTILRQGFMFFGYERCAALALFKRI